MQQLVWTAAAGAGTASRRWNYPRTQVMLRPAAEGTGVIAGGAVRAVLELAGVKNAFAKQVGAGRARGDACEHSDGGRDLRPTPRPWKLQLGTDNPLNNARACIEGLAAMRTFQEVADMRGLPVEHVMGRA